MRSRVALLALLALGLSFVGWALFARETDEEAIRRRLDALAAAVAIEPEEGVVARALRVKEGVEESVAPEARVSIPEIGERLDREQLVGAAVQAGQRWRAGHVVLDGVQIAMRGDGAARVEATARLEGTSGGEPRSDAREVAIELARRDGAWIVTAIDVEPRSDELDDEE